MPYDVRSGCSFHTTQKKTNQPPDRPLHHQQGFGAWLVSSEAPAAPSEKKTFETGLFSQSSTKPVKEYHVDLCRPLSPHLIQKDLCCSHRKNISHILTLTNNSNFFFIKECFPQRIFFNNKKCQRFPQKMPNTTPTSKHPPFFGRKFAPAYSMGW